MIAAIDSTAGGLYIRPMNQQTPRSPVEVELRQLEKRVDDLVTTVNQLKEENRALRQRQDTLMSERANLLQKNEQVRASGGGNDRTSEGDGARRMSEDKLSRVSVRLLDREYQVACPMDERSDLLDSAEYLDTKMREVRDSGKVVGLDRVAVISALNIANELIKLRRNGGSVDVDLGSRLKGLRERVELALEKGQQLEL